MKVARILTALAVGIGAPSCTNNNSGTGPDQVVSLAVAPDTVSLDRGDSIQLTVSALDKNNALVTGVAVTFSSADTTIVSVSNTGLVRTGSAIGTTTITVSGGGVKRDVPATVKSTPVSVAVAPADTTIKEGGSYPLRVTVYDLNNDSIPGAPVTFHSSDSTIATVSPSGVVTGVGAGQATISAQSGAAASYASLTVKDTSIVAHVTLTGSPFGTAANRQGIAYVLRPTLNVATRFDLPGTTPGASTGVSNDPTFITFDSGGTTAYETAQLAGRVDVIDVATTSVTDSIFVTGNPFIVRVSPDDKSIWVSTNVDSLYQIDRSTKAVLARYGVPLVPNGLAFAPNNDSLLYVGTQDAGKVVEINYKKQTIGRTFNPGGKTQQVVISPDGSELYVANEGLGEIEIYNLGSNAALTPINIGAGAFDLELSPDGTKLWVSSPAGGFVKEYDRASRALVRTVATGGTPRRIALTPATSTLIVANADGWVDFLK